jgi:hypothetical protein
MSLPVFLCGCLVKVGHAGLAPVELWLGETDTLQ